MDSLTENSPTPCGSQLHRLQEKEGELRSKKAQERVIVAMSGGVDSSAAALLLAEQGYAVTGVAMQVWDYRKNGGSQTRATCCAPADFDDARSVADKKRFPFYVFDFEDSFYEAVIRPFVNSYLHGLTPNPCLSCNRKVKFSELRKRAASLGVRKVATGHYAQIKELRPGEFGLFSAVDTAKDQSYFLYAMTQQDLRETLFPVGAMTKSQVRAYLRDDGIELADKAESQDICFVSSTVAEFIEEQFGLKSAKESQGDIVSSSGKKLGRHSGIHKFTVGQRRGLGVSNRSPLYVLNIDPDQNLIQVGEKGELEKSHFFVSDVHWISGTVPSESIVSRVKLRYRHSGAVCKVTPIEGKNARIDFLDQWSTVSPGQAAVFYSTSMEVDGTFQVLGGGTITRNNADAA